MKVLMLRGTGLKFVVDIRYSLVISSYGLLIFQTISYAGEKSSSKNQLEPIVTQGATVRGLTKPFEATIEGKKTYFQNGLQFAGHVLWLDEHYLDLRMPDSEVYIKIPFHAITKLEMKIEKKNWPLALGTLMGLTIGLAFPLDENDPRNMRSLKRISATATGVTSGIAAGLFIKQALPNKWQDVPLEQARLGIKK